MCKVVNVERQAEYVSNWSAHQLGLVLSSDKKINRGRKRPRMPMTRMTGIKMVLRKVKHHVVMSVRRILRRLPPAFYNNLPRPCVSQVGRCPPTVGWLGVCAWRPKQNEAPQQQSNARYSPWHRNNGGSIMRCISQISNQNVVLPAYSSIVDGDTKVKEYIANEVFYWKNLAVYDFGVFMSIIPSLCFVRRVAPSAS
jgi:hypothetical protein